MYSNFRVYPAENFRITDKQTAKDNIADIDSEDYIIDARNGIASKNNIFVNYEWYYNYIKETQHFARVNPDSRWQYLLRLGYIPIVYLPAPDISELMNQTMLDILQRYKVPYITLRATSFAVKYCDLDVMDAWISKIDASKYFGIPIEQVNSLDLIKKVYEG